MDAPPIQYARTEDGVNIAYWTIGSGPPLLHPVNHAFSHVELEWRVPALRDWYEKLAEQFQVVRFDFRSCGLSEDAPDSLGLDAYVRDLEAVVRAIDVYRLAILAVSYVSAVAMRFAARHPDELERMVLFSPWLRMPDAQRRAIEASRSMMQSDPDWRARMFAATRTGQQDPGGHFERVIRNAVSAEVQPLLVEAYMAMDVSEDAQEIQCPTFIAANRFMQAPLWAGTVAAAIPSAQLTIFDYEDAEDPFFTNPQQTLDVIVPFLSDGFAGNEPDNATGAQDPATSPDPSPASDATARATVRFTKREVEVVRLVAQGKSNPEIAEKLVISPETVKRHVSNILNKTAFSNRTELAAYAIANKLTD